MTEYRIRRRVLHPAQKDIIAEAKRFNVLDCGRRFGKTTLGIDLTYNPLLHNLPVGWFSPTYKLMIEVWREVKTIYRPLIKRVSEQERRIELNTGPNAILEMWSLEDPDAGRGRKYARVIIDEAAMVAKLEQAWNDSLRPTLADYRGSAWFLSTPKGRNFFYSLYQMGQDPLNEDWASWTRPTASNPFIAADEIEAARKSLPDRSFRQEWLGEFVQDGGGVFRGVERSVDTGRTANEPQRPDREYFAGVDLAKYEDFTVLAVVDDTGRQVFWDRFNIVSYEVQVQRIIDLAVRFPNLVLCIDSTGVGDPVVEQVKRAAWDRGVEITLFPEDGFRFTSTSKEQVINALSVSIEHGALNLLDNPVQTTELLAYQYELSNSGHLSMNAPAGMHDDAVIALALANWGRTNGERRAPVGIVSLAPEPTPLEIEEQDWVEV